MITMRFVGVLMIAASGCAAGVLAGIDRKKRYHALSELIAALDLLENEICFRCSPVCAALKTAAEASTVLRTASSIAQADPAAIPSAFRQAAATHGLSPEDTAVLSELANTVGRYGAEEQKGSIEYAKARLQARLAPEEEAAAKAAKLYKTLGICGGLAAAVILI